MARATRTAENFDSIAATIHGVSVSLAEIAQSMRDAAVPDVLVHVTLPENTHLPAIVDWVDKLKIDVRSQVRSYTAGVQSAAEKRKEQHHREKLAAAKKAVKKIPKK